MLLPRRRFLTGLTSLLAAPAIVRFESLMPVAAPKLIQKTYKIGDIISFTTNMNTPNGVVATIHEYVVTSDNYTGSFLRGVRLLRHTRYTPHELTANALTAAQHG